jgi:DNA recombination protein RmuC
MPGDGVSPVYLVIDSKSPSVSYARLQEAYECGDKALSEKAQKVFGAELRKEAADIFRKYIQMPNSLEYGVMFLPSEGMYLEALRMGMAEILRRESSVVIAGPSSMAALLSSFRAGFQMLAIHEKSEDIRRVLEEVRTEVGRFDEMLARAENHLELSRKDIAALRSTRTNAIMRKLKDVTEVTGQ